jgi:hypothetical protein
MVLGHMAKTGLNELMTKVYDTQPITNPHVMAMGIGDIYCDHAPLQVTQFEADIRIAQQLERLYFEQGGGGNDSESYTLPWYFAAHHTVTDSFEKRGKKGFLFTVGDEMPNSTLDMKGFSRTMKRQPSGSLDTEELLALVTEKWDVFHIVVAEGSFARSNRNMVRDAWSELLGPRAIWLKDHRKMADAIVATMIEANGGSILGSALSASISVDTDHFVRAMDLS